MAGKGGRTLGTWTKDNPGPGRPPGSGRVKRCREWADKYGFAFLEALAEGRASKEFNIVDAVDPELRERAAEYLINRGYGKTPQGIDVTSGGEPVRFTLGLGAPAKDDGGDA